MVRRAREGHVTYPKDNITRIRRTAMVQRVYCPLFEISFGFLSYEANSNNKFGSDIIKINYIGTSNPQQCCDSVSIIYSERFMPRRNRWN